IHLFNGTFAPVLSTYSAATGTWTSRTAPMWSTVNDASFGGLAAYGDYVYVTDMETFGETLPDSGIVRFDLATGTVDRFAAGTDYITMTLGLDGVLYAMRAPSGAVTPIDAFDPATMDFVRTVTAPVPDGRGVAVAANGHIYVGDLAGSVYHLDRNG